MVAAVQYCLSGNRPYPMSDRSSPGDWATEISSEEYFRDEQARLADNWTFAGMMWDLPFDNAWFRTTAAGREIFVQRFADGVRAFENVCAHRFMRLRRADRGVGPIVCGFHHWRYDADGRAVGIPHCRQNFGKSPGEIDARLTRLDVATVGAFIYVRTLEARDGAERPDLDTWLGPMRAIMIDRFPMDAKARSATRMVSANWKLCWRISLDDYHVVAVHPSTFGRSGYIPKEHIQYHRAHPHSAYFTAPHTTDLEGAAAACADGRYEPRGYRSFYVHLGATVAEFRTLFLFKYRVFHTLVLHYAPEAAGQSKLQIWIAPSPHMERGLASRPLRLLALLMTPYVLRRALKILEEDHAVCADLQVAAGQARGAPIYGEQETRVRWFDDAYRRGAAEADQR